MALAACAPTTEAVGDGGGEAFVFSSLIERSFAITVVDGDGMPLPGISISVEDVYESDRNDESASAHSVYLRGLTNADGAFRASARMPSLARVDVVVHDDSGRAGPWTNEQLRDQLGYFAPSSRQEVSISNGDVHLFVALAEAL